MCDPRPTFEPRRDGTFVLQMTAVFLRAIFDRYLNGHYERLPGGPNAHYPEITFEQGTSR